MNKLRLGVIGATGFADRTAIPEFVQSKKIEIVSVHGRDQDKVGQVASRHGIPKWTTNVYELVSDPDIDAVYIASPVFLHRSDVLAAAANQKHVLCEKPLALNVAECHDMIAACRKAGVVFMPAFMMRYNPAHVEIKKQIEAGAVGQVITLRAQFGFWYPENPTAWRQVKRLGGSGALADVGSHCIDLLRFLAGDIVEVSCQAQTARFSYDVDDVAVLLMRHQTGAISIVDVYFSTRKVENRLEVNGTDATILSEGSIAGRSHSRYRILRPEGKEAIEVPFVSPYVGEIDDFAKAIATKSEPRVTAIDGLRCQEVMEAALQSSETGTTVRLMSP